MTKYLNYIKTFNKYRYLLSLLVKRDIEKKYQGSSLGIAWSLLTPLLEMIVLTIVFSALFKRDISNFPLYVITGKLIFNLFSTCTKGSLKSLINSSALIKKINFPKYMVTLSSIISSFVIFCISLIDLAIVMVITGAPITINLLFLPVILSLFLLMIIGVAFTLSILNTYFRDVEHFYGVLLLLVMYASAIFYPSNIVPEHFQWIFLLNPIYQFIEAIRSIVYLGTMPSVTNFVLCIGYSVIIFIIGIVVFEKHQNRIVMKL